MTNNNDFTYNENKTTSNLEMFEWDRVWWEHTDYVGRVRILWIGDSISCGTREIATDVAEKEMLFDGFGTSKAIDNPYLKLSVDMMISQSEKYSAIILNNGLHGWHLSATEYKKHYEDYVKHLLSKYPDIPLVLVLTTIVKNTPDRIKEVELRNNAVKEIAEKYSLKVIDLYSVSVNNQDLISSDNVHFTREGYEQLAKEVVSSLKKILHVNF